MNRNHTLSFDRSNIGVVDIIAVERQARAMQARMMGELFRSAWRWVSARLRRAPAGQTA